MAHIFKRSHQLWVSQIWLLILGHLIFRDAEYSQVLIEGADTQYLGLARASSTIHYQVQYSPNVLIDIILACGVA